MLQVDPSCIKGGVATTGSPRRRTGHVRPVTKVFAHRGDTADAPDNTIEAFLAAVEHGADGVELDVRRTRDGALVVHHDAAVAGLGPIAALAFRELPSHVALLGDALEVLEPIEVNVEIKNDPDEPGYDPTGSLSHDVAALLVECADLERIVVSSFDLGTLDALNEAGAGIATGLLLGLDADPLDGVTLALRHGFGAVHPFVLGVDADVLDAAHRAGLDVNTWTVNARHDLVAMVSLGVDVVITDVLALALEVVTGAGGQLHS
jgi:glycerophosphoryl diester phosphodiesterase